MLEVVAHNSPDGVTLPAWQERTGPVTLPGLPDPRRRPRSVVPAPYLDRLPRPRSRPTHRTREPTRPWTIPGPSVTSSRPGARPWRRRPGKETATSSQANLSVLAPPDPLPGSSPGHDVLAARRRHPQPRLVPATGQQRPPEPDQRHRRLGPHPLPRGPPDRGRGVGARVPFAELTINRWRAGGPCSSPARRHS